MLDRPTLVLNRSWVAISTTTVRSALAMVYKGVACAIQTETYETHDFESWADLSVMADQPGIRTVKRSVRVPEVILLLRHNRVPRQSVPFSRRNLYRRDRHRCQYCGDRHPTTELSIDHVVPRSRGGRTLWEKLRARVHRVQRPQGEPLAASGGDEASLEADQAALVALLVGQSGTSLGILGALRQRAVLERDSRRELSPLSPGRS